MDTFVLDVENKNVNFLYNNFLLLFIKLKINKGNFYYEKIKKLKCIVNIWLLVLLFLSTIILPFSNNAHSTHSTSTIAPHGSFFVDDDDI